MADAEIATLLILCSGAAGLLFALYNVLQVSRVKMPLTRQGSQEHSEILAAEDATTLKVAEITASIARGANSFLFSEYRILAIFIVGFGLVVFFALGTANGWVNGTFSALSFVLGGCTSIASGYMGMKAAVYANGRTCLEARKGYSSAFNTAFRAGAVMGFGLVSFGLIILFVAIALFKTYYDSLDDDKEEAYRDLYEAVAGYGLGGSSIALFGRVGGGIYTKAADVGADLVGKVEQDIPEDDPRNPAVIADNVGDNVGDVAGMGADLFGSFAESTCAALVIASTATNAHGVSLVTSWEFMMFPLLITAMGILVCILTSFVATNVLPVHKEADIEPTLKRQLIISTVLMTPLLYGLATAFLPSDFFISEPDRKSVRAVNVFICVVCGLWSGLIIGYVTDYFTSHAHGPVHDVATSCNTGAATNIIYGLALGYKSTIIPAVCLAVTIYWSYKLAAIFGVAIAALGILSTLAIGLTIDAYGPISDNAGGIAEMAGLGPEVRERTDALDAAGNTTAAVGKGFAIGSAALVSLALFGAFIARVSQEDDSISVVNILKPYEFAGLLVGSMLPYAFSAMTMKSVGLAALAMVQEVRRQFREIPGLMEGTADPDYETCVSISTKASLKEMILPGVMVMGTPLLVGFIFGVHALAGLLIGNLVSGVQMAISSANSGGAWDNAKKFIEQGNQGGKGSASHKAAVVGDTVGDPLKDTSGPSLNILMKLMAIISLVFSPFFAKYGGILN